MMQTNLLLFANKRYLKLSLVLLCLCVGLYISQNGAEQPANGGTWQGYILGSIGAFLILLLMWQGVRKRSYYSTMGTVQGWTSMHVYLGIVLPIIVTLHSDGQLGFNVHSLAYALLLIVIFSGFYGLYLTLIIPRLTLQNFGDDQRGDLSKQLILLNDSLTALSNQGQSELQQLVHSAVLLTNIDAGMKSILTAQDTSKIQLISKAVVSNKQQQTIIDYIAKQIPNSVKQKEAKLLHQLLAGFAKRQNILNKLRKGAQYSALTKAWLKVHIPFTLALVAALIGHVVSVFFYW